MKNKGVIDFFHYITPTPACCQLSSVCVEHAQVNDEVFHPISQSSWLHGKSIDIQVMFKLYHSCIKVRSYSCRWASADVVRVETN